MTTPAPAAKLSDAAIAQAFREQFVGKYVHTTINGLNALVMKRAAEIDAARNAIPFVAYAHDQGIMGAEEAGRALEEAARALDHSADREVDTPAAGAVGDAALRAVVLDIRAHCNPPNPESDDEVSAAYALSWADRIDDALGARVDSREAGYLESLADDPSLDGWKAHTTPPQAAHGGGGEDGLKVCPFCPDGGDPKLVRMSDDDGEFAVVSCQRCGCATRQHYFLGDDAERQVTSAWNTRTAPVAGDGGRDAVVRALKELRGYEYRRGDLIHQRDLGDRCMCVECIESRADAALTTGQGDAGGGS